MGNGVEFWPLRTPKKIPEVTREQLVIMKNRSREQSLFVGRGAIRLDISCESSAADDSHEISSFIRFLMKREQNLKKTSAANLFGLILYVPFNSYGHVGTVSSPIKTTLFSWASLTKQLSSSASCTNFCLKLTTTLLESAEGRRMAVEIIS